MTAVVYTVRNLTNGNLSFDDKTLRGTGATVTTTKLTDDLLAAYRMGLVALDPVPPNQAPGTVRFDPCQFPIPVRMVGGFQGLYTPASIVAVPVTTVDETPIKVVGFDGSRVNFRLRNTGANPVALGGSDVTFGDAVHILAAGALFNEVDAPNVAWWAVAQAGLPSTLVGLKVQT